MRTLFLLGAWLACGAASFAQVSLAGTFMTNVTGGKVAVVVGSGMAAIYHFDTANNRVDSAGIALNAANQGSASTLYGLTAAVTISRAAAAGTIGGVTFAAPRVPLTGAYNQIGYTGTLMLNGNANNLKIGITPTGAVLMHYFHAAPGVLLTGGGIGTIDAQNVITVPTVAGTTATFSFTPQGATAAGAIQIGALSLQYLLNEATKPRLVNISTRGSVGGGRILIAGFVAAGGSKTFLIRAVGPGLVPLGVPAANTNPALAVVRSGVQIATNDDWAADVRAAETAPVASQMGAFALAAGSRDAAMVVTLEAGVYSAIVSSAAAEGDALVEVYEVN